MSLGFARFRAPTFADVATGRDNNLNLLRMLAASSVLFSHSYALTGHMLQEPLVVASGQRTDAATIGVIVFFAISGFLIAQSLARTPSLYAYTIARGLRILPGLMLAKLFCVLVLGWYATSLASAAYWTHADAAVPAGLSLPRRARPPARRVRAQPVSARSRRIAVDNSRRDVVLRGGGSARARDTPVASRCLHGRSTRRDDRVRNVSAASWHAVEKAALGLKARLVAWRPRVVYGFRKTTRS